MILLKLLHVGMELEILLMELKMTSRLWIKQDDCLGFSVCLEPMANVK